MHNQLYLTHKLLNITHSKVHLTQIIKNIMHNQLYLTHKLLHFTHSKVHLTQVKKILYIINYI